MQKTAIQKVLSKLVNRRPTKRRGKYPAPKWECALCDQEIRAGNLYRSAGDGVRAHETCIVSQPGVVRRGIDLA